MFQIHTHIYIQLTSFLCSNFSRSSRLQSRTHFFNSFPNVIAQGACTNLSLVGKSLFLLRFKGFIFNESVMIFCSLFYLFCSLKKKKKGRASTICLFSGEIFIASISRQTNSSNSSFSSFKYYHHQVMYNFINIIQTHNLFIII